MRGFVYFLLAITSVSCTLKEKSASEIVDAKQGQYITEEGLTFNDMRGLWWFHAGCGLCGGKSYYEVLITDSMMQVNNINSDYSAGKYLIDSNSLYWGNNRDSFKYELIDENKFLLRMSDYRRTKDTLHRIDTDILSLDSLEQRMKAHLDEYHTKNSQ